MKPTEEFRSRLIGRYSNNKINFDGTLAIINQKRKRIYNDGPQITFDSGYTWTSLFKILFEMENEAPTRAKMTQYLVNRYGMPDSPGLYLLEAKGRRMIVTTKSIAKSYAKVLYELLHTDDKLDIFLRRLSAAPQVSFKVLYTGPTTHRMGATYAGMYDTMNPAIALTPNSFDYRKFAYAYRKGLAAGGNFVSLTIEGQLVNGTRPGFITEEEALAWNPDFVEVEVIPDDVFDHRMYAVINEHSKVEFHIE